MVKYQFTYNGSCPIVHEFETDSEAFECGQSYTDGPDLGARVRKDIGGVWHDWDMKSEDWVNPLEEDSRYYPGEELTEHYWPGDGSGGDDLADYNQMEADDYRDE